MYAATDVPKTLKMPTAFERARDLVGLSTIVGLLQSKFDSRET